MAVMYNLQIEAEIAVDRMRQGRCVRPDIPRGMSPEQVTKVYLTMHPMGLLT